MLPKTFNKRLFSSRGLLHIYDPGHNGMRNSISGIRATIFGPTGFMGKYVAAGLGYISSDLVLPSTHAFRMDDKVKELKLCANLGQSFIVREMNFKNPKMIERVISTSNVVINLVGPKARYTDPADFEWVNVEIPRRIARACANNPNIIRMIHMSCAGADENSTCIDFSTKWKGEQAVLEQFPDATIFRPTTVYGPNDHFVQIFKRKVNFLGNGLFVYDDCMAKRQPMHIFDLSQCVLNALKLPETAGRTYELGGPHVYTRKELMEIMFNIMKKPPGLIHVPRSIMEPIVNNVYNTMFWNKMELEKDLLDIVVREGARGIDELCVNPVSFHHGVEELLYRDADELPQHAEEDER